jgi:hypothetical protein
LTRIHCDNCDKVLVTTPFQADCLLAKLANGTEVQVQLVLSHPLTQRQFALCAECARHLIDSAVPSPYLTAMKR